MLFVIGMVASSSGRVEISWGLGELRVLGSGHKVSTRGGVEGIRRGHQIFLLRNHGPQNFLALNSWATKFFEKLLVKIKDCSSVLDRVQ